MGEPKDWLQDFLKNCYLFISCWLCWVFVAARGFSLVAESGGSSQVAVCGPLISMASLVPEHGLKDVQASVVGDTGFIALQRVECLLHWQVVS